MLFVAGETDEEDCVFRRHEQPDARLAGTAHGAGNLDGIRSSRYGRRMPPVSSNVLTSVSANFEEANPYRCSPLQFVTLQSSHAPPGHL